MPNDLPMAMTACLVAEYIGAEKPDCMPKTELMLTIIPSSPDLYLGMYLYRANIVAYSIPIYNNEYRCKIDLNDISNTYICIISVV